jgi:transcription antitermination factor NusG
LPVSGKKAELVERVLKAREVEASGADPARAFERETRAKEDAEAEARHAMESRRAARRERRAGPGRAARASEVSKKMDSIMATTRLVEDMKEKGATEVQREFVVQKFMSESIEKSGWFMVETPEEREESALKDILGLNGTRVTRGQGAVDAWVPKIPTADFYVTAADAEGKSALELCQMVEEGEMLQPGYVLVKCVLTQQLLDSFDDLRSVRGFATGGSSRFGAKKYQIVNQPTTVDDQIPRMIRACTPRVLTEEDVELEKAREEARVIREEAAAVEAGDDLGDMRPTSSRVEESTGLGRVEVHTGPFKGFKGRINVRNDDGSVEATLAIFGRDTSVSLDKSEFREI